MKRLFVFLGLGTFACAMTFVSTAIAQQDDQDCLCDGRYELGQAVTLLVDNPADARGLDAGTAGKVLCANDRINGWVLVGWLGYDNRGKAVNGLCECGELDWDQKGWWVKCQDIRPGWPVPELGACCMQDQCQQQTQEGCEAAGGQYLGDGEPCQDDSCSCGQPMDCPDLTRDGVVDMRDFRYAVDIWLEYQGQFNVGKGDVDGDCWVTIDDIIAVINGWGVCPPQLPFPEDDDENGGDAEEADPAANHGACCYREQRPGGLVDVCDVFSEDECADQQDSRWRGIGSTCSVVQCDSDEIGEVLCQCDGEFAVGDRVTLTHHNPYRNRDPELPIGSWGTVVCAQGNHFRQRVTVHWDNWRDQRPEPGGVGRLDATRMCDCGGDVSIHEVWSTFAVECRFLMPGEVDVEAAGGAGACCLGDYCRTTTEGFCQQLGGSWMGNGSVCNAIVCGGEELCGCGEQWSVGDRVQLTEHVLGGQAGLNRGLRGTVICTSFDGDGAFVRWDFLNVDGFFREFAWDVCECGYMDPSPFNDPRMKTVMVPCEVLEAETP
jgi:hypothetical protein